MKLLDYELPERLQKHHNEQQWRQLEAAPQYRNQPTFPAVKQADTLALQCN